MRVARFRTADERKITYITTLFDMVRVNHREVKAEKYTDVYFTRSGHTWSDVMKAIKSIIGESKVTFINVKEKSLCE